ncbi:iron complex transport system substrate-binding protein [Alkalispirochaeta americana]|uniref:Iron complex transport system substrate-binding protein n=1 Tax=Alkalispirochaeta americana TaxID=159291 RepID=A0A1N6PV60_9SPIO|nr:ABC transporter substrate-binding protein [Alkalispirochaeta americana]SIQ08230.1 iron complex transport system substrate-binding protein [Alkalispirochaeta americana]
MTKTHQKKRTPLWVILATVILTVTLFSSFGRTESAEDSLGEGGLQGWVVTDHLGRDVYLKAPPQRIVGLSRQFMEELYAIGLVPVGKVEEYNNRPEMNALPSLGRQGSPDIEAILALEPDLIIANVRQHSEMTEMLESMGATVAFVDPSFEGDNFFTDRILLFAQLTGREQEAAVYCEHITAVLEEVQQQIAPLGYERGIIVQGGSEMIQAAQPTGLYGALLPSLGIQNVVPANLPGSGRSTFVTYDIEAITEADPDILVIRSAGSGERNLEWLRTYYLDNPLWQGVRAVRQGQVFVLPQRVNPGNLSSEEALRITADVISNN